MAVNGNFVLKAIVAPVLVIAITGVGGFALGHTQSEGHDKSVVRLNDGLVRIGKLEERQERIREDLHNLELKGADDRFRGSDADAMEARLQTQLDSLGRDIEKIKKELGIR